MKIDDLTQMIAFLIYFYETNIEEGLDFEYAEKGKKEFLVWKSHIHDFYQKETIERTYDEWKTYLDEVLTDQPHWGDCVGENTSCMRCLAEEYLEKAEKFLKTISMLDIEDD